MDTLGLLLPSMGDNVVGWAQGRLQLRVTDGITLKKLFSWSDNTTASLTYKVSDSSKWTVSVNDNYPLYPSRVYASTNTYPNCIAFSYCQMGMRLSGRVAGTFGNREFDVKKTSWTTRVEVFSAASSGTGLSGPSVTTTQTDSAIRNLITAYYGAPTSNTAYLEATIGTSIGFEGMASYDSSTIAFSDIGSAYVYITIDSGIILVQM